MRTHHGLIMVIIAALGITFVIVQRLDARTLSRREMAETFGKGCPCSQVTETEDCKKGDNDLCAQCNQGGGSSDPQPCPSTGKVWFGDKYPNGCSGTSTTKTCQDDGTITCTETCNCSQGGVQLRQNCSGDSCVSGGTDRCWECRKASPCTNPDERPRKKCA